MVIPTSKLTYHITDFFGKLTRVPEEDTEMDIMEPVWEEDEQFERTILDLNLGVPEGTGEEQLERTILDPGP